MKKMDHYNFFYYVMSETTYYQGNRYVVLNRLLLKQ